jgi:P-type Cu2+ transporter
MRTLLNWGSWILSLPVMAFSAMPFFSGAWRSLRGLLARRAGAIGMDVPVALGLIITFVASTGATFDPAGPFGHEVYFDSLTMFVSFLLGARWIELQGARPRRRGAGARAGGCPRPPGVWPPTAASAPSARCRLHVGDRVQVPLGQAFPADGTLQEGHGRPTSPCSPASLRRWPSGPATRSWPAASTSARPVRMRWSASAATRGSRPSSR